MGNVFDEEWLKAYTQRTGKGIRTMPERAGSGSVGDEASPGRSAESETPDAKCARTKYGNVRACADGQEFDSKLEERVYQLFKARMLGGEYIGLARQVTFTLPGGVKYVADFVMFDANGHYEVYDAKSAATRKDKVYRIKKKQMAECLGIEVREI